VLPAPMGLANVTVLPFVSIKPPIWPLPGLNVMVRPDVERSTVLPVAYCSVPPLRTMGPPLPRFPSVENCNVPAFTRVAPV